MTARECWELSKDKPFTLMIGESRDGRITEQYVLLSRKGGDVQKLENLRDRRLIVCTHRRAELAPLWLDTLLLQNSLGEAADLCRKITEEPIPSKAILHVFFGQADCCVVSRSSFAIMSELHPQVSQRLGAIAVSPLLTPVVFVFRNDYQPAFRSRLVEEIFQLGASPDGMQLLNIFQADGLVEVHKADLASVFELLSRRQRLSEAAKVRKRNE